MNYQCRNYRCQQDVVGPLRRRVIELEAKVASLSGSHEQRMKMYENGAEQAKQIGDLLALLAHLEAKVAEQRKHIDRLEATLP